MARDTDGIWDDDSKWATDGDTAEPTYDRTDGWGVTFSQEGGDAPARPVFNKLLLQLFSLGIDVNKFGCGLPYNATVDYAIEAIVVDEIDGLTYRGLTNPNLNNTPSSDDGTNWKQILSNVLAEPEPERSTMVGNETFTYPSKPWLIAFLDPNGASRNFDPSGTFVDGFQIAVINEDTTDNIVFDSGDIAHIVRPANNVIFIYNEDSDAWVVLSDTFSFRGVAVNNANGNPNISDTLFDVEDVTLNTWESVGPTAGGGDHQWPALDTVPGDVDWIKIKFYFDGTENSGTPDAPLDVIMYVRKTGGAQAVGTDNMALFGVDIVIASGIAHVSQLANHKVGVDANGRFDLYFKNSYPAVTSFAFLTLIGYGYNDD